MSDNQKPCAATPNADLETQIVSSCIPKNEREWWAHHEILKQRQRIAQLEAALKQEQEAHEEDVAQLGKHCACEWDGQEPRRQTVTCGTHQKLEARVKELEEELHVVKVERGRNAMSHMNEYHRAERWKAKAQWAAGEIASLYPSLLNLHTLLLNGKDATLVNQTKADLDRAKRILNDAP